MKNTFLAVIILLFSCKQKEIKKEIEPQKKDTTKVVIDSIDKTIKVVCDTAGVEVVSVCAADTCKNKKAFLIFLSGGCSQKCIKLNKSLYYDLKEFESIAKCTFKITSAFRSASCNVAVGGAANSSHLKSPIVAMDLQAVTRSGIFNAKAHNAVASSINKKGRFFEFLLKKGYCGFGIYERHIHLDKDKSKGYNNKHKGYLYRIWVVKGSAVSVGC